MNTEQKRIINLTRSQTKFFDDTTSKAVAFVSGFGGGKSFSLCTKLIKTKLKYPKADLLYLLPTFSMFRDIFFPTLNEILEGTGIQYKINRTTGEVFFDGGGRIILKSMDAPDSIVGMNVLAVFLDELDTLPTDKARNVWQKSIARARKFIQRTDDFDKPIHGATIEGHPILATNQMNVGTTPEGFRFVYEMFEKNRPDNYKLIQASGRENIYLPSDYYDNLKKIYPEQLVDAYVDGKFVNLTQGSVYKEFDRDKCDCDSIYRHGEHLHISMDFNVMNMNSVVFVERDPVFIDDPTYQYEGANSFHAIHHFKDVRDTPEMIEVIKNRYPNSPVTVYPDASGKNTSSKGFTTSDISILKKAGFAAKYPNKNPRIMERVQSINSAFKTGLIKVNVSQCSPLADALEQQVFNPNTELPEKSSGSSIDDINDAFGYFVHYTFPIKRKQIKSKELRGY